MFIITICIYLLRYVCVYTGRFVPNKLTLDSNSNKRIDILRCKMTDTQRAYMELARSEHQLQVRIFSDKISFIFVNSHLEKPLKPGYIYLKIHAIICKNLCIYGIYMYIFVKIYVCMHAYTG